MERVHKSNILVKDIVNKGNEICASVKKAHKMQVIGTNNFSVNNSLKAYAT